MKTKVKASDPADYISGAHYCSDTQQLTRTNSAKMTEIQQVGVGDIKVVKMMMDRCNTEEQMKSIKVQQQLKRKIAEKLPGSTGNS